MASRPRRSAATRANESISVHARWADASDKIDRNTMSSRRSGRTSGASALRDAPSSPEDSNISVNVKTSTSRSRQAARGTARGRAEKFEGGEIVTGTRNRGGRKNYVIDSSPDDDEGEEEEAEIDDAEEDDDDVEEDAEGEEMEVDAEGEDVDAEGEEDAEGEDADGDIDMGVRTAPTIRVSHSSSTRPAARAAASKIVADEDDEEDDDDDEELSDPGESDGGDQTLGFADETMADDDEDAEGEEIEVAGEEEDDEDEVEEEEAGEGRPRAAELDSDEDGSQAGSPDLNKMTKRQRARFEEEPQEYMKLSDEVQVKKHFTAEELSMRRQEMARRRRNLSEKRTEEVKMETINKLLKKQAPKINRKAAAAAARGGSPEDDQPKADPLFIRWVSTKGGVSVSVPEDIVNGPAGRVFAKGGGLESGKMVEEVA
ncbi:hypothetical protein JDV02_002649 [Purpureocillium takamizusanense]|uniref:INO80 complex subunit B-like conserved region domain-containing protein n=2 Tax=Purpureocillium takamizusanense TaxID=2060973 RepID=A0A9Q8V7Y3_9HYPO|nr:uncharacterized protein JDV02_002649 [Purpureocillium takamizusanense]UNI16188.1 hypothetical protein JDV02_002649 [Purpureocillium takamizusanense]